MIPDSSRGHAFGVAAATCIVLLGIAFIVLKFFPLSATHHDDAFFLLLFFSIALITVIAYQSQRLQKTAQNLAQNMSEDILLYSHELFSELYRSSPVPYIVIDMKGKIESANFSTARLFDIEISALTGVQIFECIEGDTHKVELIAEYFKEGKFVNNVEARLRRPDGMVKWVLISLFSFSSTHGVRKGLMTLFDITKLKQIDIAKTEFVSLASHQLRTPISGMQWNVELLLTQKNEILSDAHRKYVEKISNSLQQMNMLVEDFLSASKFELGTLTAILTTVDIHEFLTSIYEQHREFAERKNVKIEINIPEGTVQSDTHLLHMVASNLLGNAVKYTDKGGTVRFDAVLDGTHLTLTVADTGIGIPLADQETIFSKMFRATNARNHASGGTGLGLYIAKEAVSVLKGSVTFESKEAVGTTFTVILPR